MSLLEHVADKFTGVPATMVRREKFSILRTNGFSAVIGQECMLVPRRTRRVLSAVGAESVDGDIDDEEEYYSFPQLAAEACLNRSLDAVRAEIRPVRYARRRGDETVEELGGNVADGFRDVRRAISRDCCTVEASVR